MATAGMAVSDANDARHMYPRNKLESPLQVGSERLILRHKRPGNRAAGVIASLVRLTRSPCFSSRLRFFSSST